MFKEIFTESKWPMKLEITVKGPDFDKNELLKLMKHINSDPTDFGYDYGAELADNKYSFSRTRDGSQDGEIISSTIVTDAMIYSGRDKKITSAAFKDYFKSQKFKTTYRTI